MFSSKTEVLIWSILSRPATLNKPEPIPLKIKTPYNHLDDPVEDQSQFQA